MMASLTTKFWLDLVVRLLESLTPSPPSPASKRRDGRPPKMAAQPRWSPPSPEASSEPPPSAVAGALVPPPNLCSTLTLSRVIIMTVCQDGRPCISGPVIYNLIIILVLKFHRVLGSLQTTGVPTGIKESSLVSILMPFSYSIERHQYRYQKSLSTRKNGHVHLENTPWP